MDKFPFPEEDSAPAANSAAPRSGSSAPPLADAPGAAGDAGAAAKKKAAADNPFPDEDPKAGAGGSSSSSSSSSSSDDDPSASPDAAGLKDKGSEGEKTQGRHLLHRVNPIGTKLMSDDEREAEDLDVAHYYTQTGDLKGAYLRTQDAVKIAPDDPDAHFALAEAALKLGKNDEAIAEYAACLKLDPIDKEAKTARKELARLKPEPASSK
jgi:tetratricopeptide (TPR) repeat protein